MQAFVRSWPRAIVHIDGDAFFASCEQAMHPEWKGKPVVTGKERGIVAAASYEAKQRGVTRATPLWQVKKICPEAIIVPSDYESYSLFSKRMFAVMRRFTPAVEEYSIDEGFADITGLRRVHRGSYEDIARRMKHAIDTELGITVSVGISLTKTLAKIGSDHQKPNGLTAVSGRQVEAFLRGMKPSDVWGIGPATSAQLATYGVRDALEFARKPEAWVRERFTKPTLETWRELNGDPVFALETQEKTTYATIGKTRTFTPASEDRETVYAQLLKNLENACIKARRHNLTAKGVALFLKRQDYKYAGTEMSLTRATAYPLEMDAAFRAAFARLYVPRTPYRATGVVLLGLQEGGATQLGLFEKPVALEKMKRLYGAVDLLAEKFGKHAVRLGGSKKAHEGQHLTERGDVPLRKMQRLKGETARQHLTIPVLGHKI